MTHVPIDRFAELDLSRLKQGEAIALIKEGVEVAVLVDPGLLEKIEDYFDAQQTETELKQAEAEGFVPWDEAKRQLGL